MRDLWLIYDYLGRWWPWLLLAPTLGALAGLAYFSTQVHHDRFVATADVVIGGPEPEFGAPPEILVTIKSDLKPTQEEAAADLASRVELIANFTKGPASVRGAVIRQFPGGSPWWKAVTLGSVIFTFLVFAGIYVLEDTRTYLGHRRQIGADT